MAPPYALSKAQNAGIAQLESHETMWEPFDKSHVVTIRVPAGSGEGPTLNAQNGLHRSLALMRLELDAAQISSMHTQDMLIVFRYTLVEAMSYVSIIASA